MLSNKVPGFRTGSVRPADAMSTDHRFDASQSFEQPAQEPRTSTVPVGKAWSDAGLHLRFSLPAVAEADCSLTVRGRSLHLSGERKEPEFFGHDGRAHYALPYGPFERVVDLPAGLNTDGMTRNFHHGVLDVCLPYAPEARLQTAPVLSGHALATPRSGLDDLVRVYGRGRGPAGSGRLDSSEGPRRLRPAAA